MYQEPGPIEEGKDISYYIEREKMLLRKVEVNDKVKAAGAYIVPEFPPPRGGE